MVHEAIWSDARTVTANREGTDGDEPMDVLMRRLVDAFAQYMRPVIRSRTRVALEARLARGEKTGGPPPIGLSVGNDGATLCPDDRKRAVLSCIRRTEADGLSIRRIVDRLDADVVREWS